jgi:hypothetical protein
MAIQKYDIPLPDGTWVERFWSPRNVPILDDEGRVVLLLHRSDDITDYVRGREEARQEAVRGQHRVESATGLQRVRPRSAGTGTTPSSPPTVPPRWWSATSPGTTRSPRR